MTTRSLPARLILGLIPPITELFSSSPILNIFKYIYPSNINPQWPRRAPPTLATAPPPLTTTTSRETSFDNGSPINTPACSAQQHPPLLPLRCCLHRLNTMESIAKISSLMETGSSAHRPTWPAQANLDSSRAHPRRRTSYTKHATGLDKASG